MLVSLPDDLRLLVITFLYHRDLLAVSMTAKLFAGLIHENSYPWISLCESYGFSTTTDSGFSWKTVFRSERFLKRNFGSIHPIIALTEAAGQGINEVVDYILSSRAVGIDTQSDPSLAGYTQVGTSALHSAARHNQSRTVEYLLERECNADVADYNGRTPLMLAASHGHVTSCELLIGYGANPNLTTHFGFTALHFAAIIHCCAVVDLLLSNGSAVDAADQLQRTPLQVALSSLSPNDGNLSNCRRTMARLIVGGANSANLPEKAEALGFLEISSWLRQFRIHSTDF